MVYLCAAMITLLMLFGACSTPPQKVTITAVPNSTTAAIVVTASPTGTAIATLPLKPDPLVPNNTPVADVAAQSPTPTPKTTSKQDVLADPIGDIYANVTEVDARGSAGAYAFSVTVRSPDTGCTQYADWWEVLSEEGELLYRRVLAHSHTEEQPFTRSGGPVEIEASQEVVVRAHMSTSGYGGEGMKGSLANGFDIVKLGPDFAPDGADHGPLPDSCAF